MSEVPVQHLVSIITAVLHISHTHSEAQISTLVHTVYLIEVNYVSGVSGNLAGPPPKMAACRVASIGGSSERKHTATNAADGGGPSRKCRKERASNWSALEILDMVAAKRQEFLEDIEVEDARELMHPEQTKWGKIANKVNEAGRLRGGHSPRDVLACKYKWQTLLADCKKVADFHKGTGLVGNEYFELKSKEKKEKRLLA
jgi:hypothetical protein